MLNDAPRRASRPTASRNYTPRARPMFSIARAAAAARDASESGRDAGIVCRRAAIVRATSGCCIRRPVPRDRSRAPTASPRTVFGDGPASRFATSDQVPGTRGARSPATDFSSLGAREIGRSVGAGFPDSRRRPRADVVARTSSSSSSSRGASRQWKTRARRERDASATRARREPTRTDDGPRRRDRTARRDRGARAAVCV